MALLAALTALAVPVVTRAQVPTVTIAATDASASEIGPDPGAFTITRTGSTASALIVGFTIDGTALNSADYPLLGTAVTIPANQASTTIAITPNNDPFVEGPETVLLTLNDGAEYDLGAETTATVTIADHDAPVVTVAATDANASEVGPDPGTFSITRTGDLTFALIVGFTIDGTALNSADYPLLGTAVTIPANQASATITITPNSDPFVETPETVLLTLNDGAQYDLGAETAATVTIADAPEPTTTTTSSVTTTTASTSSTTSSSSTTSTSTSSSTTSSSATSSTAPAPSTTTTTAPPCPSDPGLQSILCRLDLLVATVQTAGIADPPRAALLRTLARARKNLAKAIDRAGAGKTRAAGRGLGRTRAALASARRKLASNRAQLVIDPLTRGTLLASVDQLRAEVTPARRTPH